MMRFKIALLFLVCQISGGAQNMYHTPLPVFKAANNSVEMCANEVNNPYLNPPKELLGLSPTGKLSREQALFDIDALVYNLNEIHPNMYANCGIAEFVNKVSTVKAQMPDSVTRVELYERAAPLVAMLNDGHTMMHFPGCDIFSQDFLREPFIVHIDDNDASVSVKASACPELLPEGVKIKSINGVEIPQMIEWMMTFVSGERSFFKLWYVNELFPLLLQMKYHSDRFEIEYYDGKKVKKTSVPAMPLSDLDKIFSEKSKQTEAPRQEPYYYEILDKTAVLTFNSCQNREAMSQFADSMVTELNNKNVKWLIIDIRANGGGDNNVGNELLKRISPTPFCQFGLIYNKVSEATLKFTDREDEVGLYYYGTELIHPLEESKRFKGKTILLTSHLTFSSAASFSWAYKYFDMGTVVGEETGGMNVSYGNWIRYFTPVSRLSATISIGCYWHYGADEKNIHGTLPDIKVPADKALEYALKKLAK